MPTSGQCNTPTRIGAKSIDHNRSAEGSGDTSPRCILRRSYPQSLPSAHEPQYNGDHQYSSGYYVLTASDVVAAVESLYDDKVQPLGRILVKRVGERAALAAAAAVDGSPAHADPALIPAIDIKQLRKICETSDRLRVEVEEGGEYSAFLKDRPPTFKDVCDPIDPYPTSLWEDLSAYLSKLGCGSDDTEVTLPGGRYACAQALVARGLPCLSYRSLGEVCHIVQLAVTRKKILGYREGNLVPYPFSELWQKEQCAHSQQPVAAKPRRPGDNNNINNNNPEPLPLASWEDVRSFLEDIFGDSGHKNCAASLCSDKGNSRSNQSSNHGGKPVPLPNVKRLFRSRYGKELSETALGHSRLFELLHDPHVSNICTVRLQGNNWVVVHHQQADKIGVPVPSPSSPARKPLGSPQSAGMTHFTTSEAISSSPCSGGVRGKGARAGSPARVSPEPSTKQVLGLPAMQDTVPPGVFSSFCVGTPAYSAAGMADDMSHTYYDRGLEVYYDQYGAPLHQKPQPWMWDEAQVCDAMTNTGTHCSWDASYEYNMRGDEFDMTAGFDSSPSDYMPTGRPFYAGQLGTHCAFPAALAGTQLALQSAELGVVVQRGPDWKWGDQDGGAGCTGLTVEGPAASDWVRVRWDTGFEGTYRCGFQGAYDLVTVIQVNCRTPSPCSEEGWSPHDSRHERSGQVVSCSNSSVGRSQRPAVSDDRHGNMTPAQSTYNKETERVGYLEDDPSKSRREEVPSMVGSSFPSNGFQSQPEVVSPAPQEKSMPPQSSDYPDFCALIKNTFIHMEQAARGSVARAKSLPDLDRDKKEERLPYGSLSPKKRREPSVGRPHAATDSAGRATCVGERRASTSSVACAVWGPEVGAACLQRWSTSAAANNPTATTSSTPAVRSERAGWGPDVEDACLQAWTQRSSASESWSSWVGSAASRAWSRDRKSGTFS